MNNKLTKKERRHFILTVMICFFVIALSVISSFSNLVKINEKNKEKRQLTDRLNELEDEEKTLTDDVEKLKNPEYAARYAREKYLYSKNGEKILKID